MVDLIDRITVYIFFLLPNRTKGMTTDIMGLIVFLVDGIVCLFVLRVGHVVE